MDYTFHIDQEFDASNTTIKTNSPSKKDIGLLIIAGGGFVIQHKYIYIYNFIN